MIKIKVKELQTVWDICIQEYGSLSGIALLMADNPGVDFQTVLTTGQILKIISDPVNKDVRDYFKNNKLYPVSGDTVDALPKDFNEDFNEDFN